MSQSGALSGSGGGGGGSVTSFLVDSQDAYAFNTGTATSMPVAGVEQIYGDNGIQVVSNSSTPGVLQVRFSRGAIATTSNETVTVLAFNTVTDSVLSMQVLVAGECPSLSQGIGGSTTVTVINVAGVASLIDTPDYDINVSAGIADATFTVDTSGSQVRIRVTGSTGNPINWSACTPGQIST